MRTSVFVSALLFSTLGAACGAGHFHKGGKMASGNAYPPESRTIYVAPKCTQLATGTVADGPKLSFYVVHEGGHAALRESNLDTGDGILTTNTWTDTDGDHYFAWVGSNGFEHVIPAEGEGVRRVYNQVKLVEAAGVTKPTSPPQYSCALVVVPK